jgi:hypothetical protein
MNPQPGFDTAAAPSRHWLFFLFGVLLVLLGPVVYVVQFQRGQLVTPWYVPLLASAGVLFMALSLWRRFGLLRTAGFVLFLLVCGFEWYALLVVARTPPYTGPVQPGGKVPAFAVALSDGTAFSDRDLATGTPTVMVFFRGRW